MDLIVLVLDKHLTAKMSLFMHIFIININSMKKSPPRPD